MSTGYDRNKYIKSTVDDERCLQDRIETNTLNLQWMMRDAYRIG